MKHLKTFENFNINETMDMMFMPVDPIAKMGDIYSDFYKEMKKNFFKFIDSKLFFFSKSKRYFEIILFN